jgi:phosphatidylglycerol:prolipoprotein diacylglycerol transferase
MALGKTIKETFLDSTYFLPFSGFYLGPVYVHTWGLTAAIGVLAAIWLINKKWGMEGGGQALSIIPARTAGGQLLFLIVSVFLGARILYILEYWNYYSSDPLAVLYLWNGGFSFFGGAVAGILAGYFWSKSNKINFLFLGWLFTPAWLFGLFFGRIGCALIQDHLGKPTDFPWGIFIQGVYRHEPALYEAIWVLLIGTTLYVIDRKFLPKRKRELGHLSNILFPLSLLLYSLGRFFIDFTRSDDPLYHDLTVAQWISIAFVVWSLWLLLQKKLSGPGIKTARSIIRSGQ